MKHVYPDGSTASHSTANDDSRTTTTTASVANRQLAASSQRPPPMMPATASKCVGAASPFVVNSNSVCAVAFREISFFLGIKTDG